MVNRETDPVFVQPKQTLLHAWARGKEGICSCSSSYRHNLPKLCWGCAAGIQPQIYPNQGKLSGQSLYVRSCCFSPLLQCGTPSSGAASPLCAALLLVFPMKNEEKKEWKKIKSCSGIHVAKHVKIGTRSAAKNVTKIGESPHREDMKGN